jgi:hypothetical protein
MYTNNRRKAKLGRQYWRINFHLLYLEVSSVSPDMTSYRDTEQDWNKGPPMCPQCSDIGKMDLDHTQRSRSPTDATETSKNGTDGGNYRNYIGLLEIK